METNEKEPKKKARPSKKGLQVGGLTDANSAGGRRADRVKVFGRGGILSGKSGEL